jgi:hypothetical protein
MKTKATKHDLEREIADLKSQLKAVRNEMAVLEETNYSRYIPFGPKLELYDHPFESDIRNAVSSQFDGRTGWVVVELGSDHPFRFVLVNVSYTNEDGTWVDSGFYRLARQTRERDYDKNVWGEWVNK